MRSRPDLRRVVVALLAGLLIGAGLMVVAPAGADVRTAVATNWKRIWKKNLRPQADKRYYTKSQSDRRHYTKPQADARYAPRQTLIRGVFFSQVSPNTEVLNTAVNFGVELADAPTVHYIRAGEGVPAGCAGTAAAPNAEVGHLCVFESGEDNVVGQFIFNPALVTSGSLTFGAQIIGYQENSAGRSWFRGTWALRPGSLTTVPPATSSREMNRAVAPREAVG